MSGHDYVIPEYYCIATCKHNNGKGNAAMRCSLKNRNNPPGKTFKCIGNKCGFYEPNKEATDNE